MPIIDGTFYTQEEVNEAKRRSESDEGDVLLSAAVGAVTGSSIVGGLVGGSLLGGILGDAVEGTDDSWL